MQHEYCRAEVNPSPKSLSVFFDGTNEPWCNGGGRIYFPPLTQPCDPMNRDQTTANMTYYRNQRRALSSAIPQGHHRILDVGCGAGHFGAYLKESGRAHQVFGLELSSEAAAEAERHLDGVVCADLDTFDLASLCSYWGNDGFDFVVCADVLEHVKDPWHTLSALTSLLRTTGKAVISLPNVRHWSVFMPLLLQGKWQYTDAGIMDRTHLRFFTHSTARDLIEGAGLRVDTVSPQIGGKWRILSRISGRLFDELIAIQYIFVAGRTIDVAKRH